MKGQLAVKYLTSNLFCLTPEYLEMMISVAKDGGVIDIQESNANTLEIDGNVAIISIDGAMVKRGDFFSNLCGMTSYAKIEKQISTAESTEGVDTLLFVVDTAGGDVAGVDNIGEKIFNSKLKTVTLYENLGASAGVWAFSASEEVYATQTTQIGSVGVVFAANIPMEDGTNKIQIVSSNAENKRCALTDKKCQEKIQARLDNIEAIFFERVGRNRGMTKEQIIAGFNQGDVVMASVAKEIGFLDGITTKDELLLTLKKGEIEMTALEQKTLSLLASHGTEEEKQELTALLATHGVNAVWDEEVAETEPIQETATAIMLNSSKIGALLASSSVLSEAEKIECISSEKTFDEICALVLEKEKGDLKSLDTTPPNVEADASKAMLDYAKNNKIRG